MIEIVTNSKCWIPIPENSDFSIYNIPFGIFSNKDETKRVGIAIGKLILDLYAVSTLGIFDHLNIDENVFRNVRCTGLFNLNTVNTFISSFSNSSKRERSHIRVLLYQIRAPSSIPLNPT